MNVCICCFRFLFPIGEETLIYRVQGYFFAFLLQKLDNLLNGGAHGEAVFPVHVESGKVCRILHSVCESEHFSSAVIRTVKVG